MKLKNQKKVLLIAVLVALLLTFTVSGTIAFLTDKTDEVQNTFTPTKVDTEIREDPEIPVTVKKGIYVTNPRSDESIDAYVRVAVVGNWCDAQGNIVKPWDGIFEYNSTYWAKEKASDGDHFYYYYKDILKVGDETKNLLADGETISKTQEGYEDLHLEVTVMQQAIQAKGMQGVNSAQSAFAELAKLKTN